MKTKSQKIRQGTYNVSREKTPPEMAFFHDFSEPPQEIADHPGAIQVWERYRDHFERIGLRAVDIPLIATYCWELANYWHFQAILNEKGHTYLAANGVLCARPECKLGRDSFDRAVRLAAKFGLALLDRQKLDMALVEPPADPKALKLARMAGI